MPKRRLLYFTISNFAAADRANGGAMYAENLVQRLMEDDEIELFVVMAGDPRNEAATGRWFSERCVELLYQPIRPEFPTPRSGSLRDVASYLYRTLFHFDYELRAYQQSHLSAAIDWAIAHWKIEHLAVDSVIAAMFAGDLSAIKIPRPIVTVNREAELYRDTLISDGFPRGRFISLHSARRFARAERKIYSSFDKVVAIGKPDIPT